MTLIIDVRVWLPNGQAIEVHSLEEAMDALTEAGYITGWSSISKREIAEKFARDNNLSSKKG